MPLKMLLIPNRLSEAWKKVDGGLGNVGYDANHCEELRLEVTKALNPSAKLKLATAMPMLLLSACRTPIY